MLCKQGVKGSTPLFSTSIEEIQSLFIDIFEDEIDMMVINRRLSYYKKVSKGVWGMPRLLEAKKDVVSCDKPRGLANVT